MLPYQISRVKIKHNHMLPKILCTSPDILPEEEGTHLEQLALRFLQSSTGW